MDEGGGDGSYIGKGIDKVETPAQAMGRKESPKSAAEDSQEKKDVRNAEEHPRTPFDRGRATGKEGSMLAAGEKNQESDKSSSNGGGWINRTGIKAGMLGGGAVGMVMRARKSGLLKGAKVAGPAATIIIILAMCFLSVMVSVSFLIASLIPNIHKTMDTLDIATSVRSRQIVTSILLGKNTKGGLMSHLPDRVKGLFIKAGATVETGANGVDKVTAIDGSGKQQVLGDLNSQATDPKIAQTINEGLAPVSNSTGLNHDSSAEFMVKETYGIESLNRNSAIEPGATPEDTKANVDASLQESLSKASSDELKADFESDNKTTEEGMGGKTATEKVETGRETKTVGSGGDVKESVEGVINDEIKEGAMEFGGIVSKVAKGVCLVYNTAMTINRMVKAYEAAQVISMGLRIFEAVQRMQAGDGGDEIISVFANYLTRAKTTEFELSEGDFTSITTSAIGSSTLAQFYGGATLTDNDVIVQSFTTSSNQFRKITDSLEGGAGYKGCTGANLTASVIDFLGEAATLGGTKIVGLLVGVGMSVGIGIAAGMIMSFLVPKIVNALKRDFLNFVEGAEGGGVIAWAAEMIIEENEKMSGMSVGTKKSLNAYVQKKADVIAERARIDRYTLSPFDTSSEYTFMGSLMASLTRASLSTSSIVGRVGRITSIVGSSLVALTPASHAADATEEIVTSGDHPEITQLVNDGQERYATAYGEPYYIPDFTSSESFEDVMWYFDAKGCFEEPYDPVSNPNPAVKMNGTGIASAKNPIILAIKAGRNSSNDATLAAYSDGGNLADEFVLADVASAEQNVLARAIEEKVYRGAPLGVPDAEIESKFETVNTGSSFWDKLISAIPVVGSFLDIISNTKKMLGMGRILGYEYQTDTKQNRMIEHYVHDQRIAEAMGISQKSQVTSYLEKYVEAHPTDKTMIGRIARRSGLTKEQVITAIKQVNALNFIASYHPDGLGPLFFEQLDVKISFESSNNYQSDTIVIIYSSAILGSKKSQDITA